MRAIIGILFTAAMVSQMGCSGVRVENYQDSKPKLNFFEYFSGETRAWGVLQRRNGKVTRRFSVVMRGEVNGDTLTLEEDFVFDDGEKTRRIWSVQKTAEGGYRGTAGDVVGEASGEASGMAINWHYQLRLPVNGRDITFTFDDWLYAIDDRRAFNRATLRKWGFRVAELSLFFEKVDS